MSPTLYPRAVLECAQLFLQPEHLKLRSERPCSDDDWSVICARVDSRRAAALLAKTTAANDEGTAPAVA